VLGQGSWRQIGDARGKTRPGDGVRGHLPRNLSTVLSERAGTNPYRFSDAADGVVRGGALVEESFLATASASVQMLASLTRRKFGAIVVRSTEWARSQFSGLFEPT
jgi:hypothetical protein